ncbi:MAG TPA: flagellar biosynthesis anti-sigma factor FlgM [Bacillota bacterium]|nr:flagellar biosynthesis anti-sigma factor FlgM [Bacillota bacterium]
MIISNKQLQSVLQMNQVSETRKKINIHEVTSVKKADSLELSSRAHELQFVREQVLKSPDIRADRIGELKKQIQEGVYQVTGSEVAHKMIGRSLVDEIIAR